MCTIGEVALPKEPAVEQTVPIVFQRPKDRQAMRGFLSVEFNGDIGSHSVFVVFQRDLSVGGNEPAPQPIAK